MTTIKHECANCGTACAESELRPIKDLSQRVEAGEPMPSGECPDCGALCHPIEVESHGVNVWLAATIYVDAANGKDAEAIVTQRYAGHRSDPMPHYDLFGPNDLKIGNGDGLSAAITFYGLADQSKLVPEADPLRDAADDMLAALHAVMRCARGELERPVTQRQPWDDAQRLVEAAIAKAEGGNTALDTPEAIIANTRRTMGKDEELCPDCGGLGADGDDCGRCHGGGSVKAGSDAAPATETPMTIADELRAVASWDIFTDAEECETQVTECTDTMDAAANVMDSMQQALEQAGHWLQEEADSPEPGATRPDEILRVIRDAIQKAKGERA